MLSGRPTSHFWRYWAGSTTSNLGSAITTVALPLTAVTVTHASALEVGGVLASGDLPWLVLGLPAGVLVSRLPLRATQVSMDLVRAVALGSVPVVYWLGALTVWQLMAAALVVGAATVIFGVGNSTIIQQLVPEEDRLNRNSIMNGSYSATLLAGPGLGGVLVQALGAASCLIFDAASYLISAVLLWSLPRPARLPSNTSGATLGQQVREGFTFLVRHPILGRLIRILVVVNLLTGAVLTLTPILLVRVLHEQAFVLGLVYAGIGAGGLLGALFVGRLVQRFGSARVVLASTPTIAAGVAIAALSFHGWGALLAAVGFALFVFGTGMTGIVMSTYRQRAVPQDLMPRVLATSRFLTWSVAPVGALLAGGLTSVTSARTALFIVATIGLAGPLIAFTSKELRQHRDLYVVDRETPENEVLSDDGGEVGAG